MLRGANVVVVRDRDDPGANHANIVIAGLRNLVARIRLTEARQGKDAADHLAAGFDLSQLVEVEFSQPPTLADLLDELRAFIRRYVVLDGYQLVAIVLWIAHTHAFEAAEATAYLNITSAEKRSGKSRLLEVLKMLVAKPWLTSKATAAVLVRKIDKQSPTLLLDESDAAFRGDKEYAEALRGVLNAGNRRDGVTSLCIKAGGDWDFQDFHVFCPKAIGGIGDLPDTVTDRSIRIEMKRKAPAEHADKLRRREAEAWGAKLCEALALWAAEATPRLRDARPEVPDQLDDRAADGWEPLFAIADEAGFEWSRNAREAALALSSGETRTEGSAGSQLLADIRVAFDEDEKLFSAALAAKLAAIEESPWGDIRGKPIDARGVAQRLRPYGVKPHNIRMADGRQNKGYELSDFRDAWSRYLPQAEPSQPSQPSQADRERVGGDSSGTVGTVGTVEMRSGRVAHDRSPSPNAATTQPPSGGASAATRLGLFGEASVAVVVDEREVIDWTTYQTPACQRCGSRHVTDVSCAHWASRIHAPA